MSEATGTESAAANERTKRAWSPARRAAAEKAAQDRARRSAAESTRSDVELVAEDQIAEAVANITALCGLMAPLAPYTAYTLAGVPGEKPGEWYVLPRAEMAGRVLLEHAKRNRRVLAAVARFNLMFRNVELVEVAASVVASVAVDAKLVQPDAAVALPGGRQLPILTPAIGDTIAFMASQGATRTVSAVHTERQARRTTSDDGVTEPDAPWGSTAGQSEPTPEQLATAHRLREERRHRDERIANGSEPTMRREGQVIVPGGVQDT